MYTYRWFIEDREEPNVMQDEVLISVAQIQNSKIFSDTAQFRIFKKYMK
jgi:hypothetical protein